MECRLSYYDPQMKDPHNKTDCLEHVMSDHLYDYIIFFVEINISINICNHEKIYQTIITTNVQC